MKRCGTCGLDKNESEFYDQKRPCGRVDKHYDCKPCYIHKGRVRRLMKKYGLTEADYIQMLEDQDSKCAICGATDNRYANQERWFAVDHDHITGEVRGLLCQTCNRMIGLAGDSVSTLQAAVEYLS